MTKPMLTGEAASLWWQPLPLRSTPHAAWAEVGQAAACQKASALVAERRAAISAQ